ncbi:MAG: hypothetical protein ACO1PI_12870 [Bacteroidota bacterium]
MESKEGLTNIKYDKYRFASFGRRLYRMPDYINFLGLSVIRAINDRSFIQFGYQSLNPSISSTVESRFFSADGTLSSQSFSTQSTTITVPSIKLNYMFSVFQSTKINPANFVAFAGLALCFKDRGPYSVDEPQENIDTTSSYERIGFRKPTNQIPFVNLGVEGSLRIGKRFKIGLELAGYIGTKTLYIEKNIGKTDDATYTYEVLLKPYFYTGGIFFQYRIK